MKRILTTLFLVCLTLLAVNAEPTVKKHAYATSENVALVLKAESGVLGKDGQTGGTLVFDSSSKGGGTVTGLEDGSFTYTPAQNFTGTDSFEYTFKKADEEVAGTVSVVIYSELRGVGWLFMIMSILGVWTLLIVCYKKLLFDGD